MTKKEIRNDKEFQRCSTDYIYKKLFVKKKAGPRRFLLADEVGLGKTVVAKSILRKVYRSKRERTNILYVCSSQELARQNIGRLVPNEDVKPVEGSRLTMLLPNLDNKAKHFIISLTPGTSIDIGRATGRKDERRFIYYLFLKLFRVRDRDKQHALRECFRCSATHIDDWKHGEWEKYCALMDGNERLSKRFRKKLKDAWNSVDITKQLSLNENDANKECDFKGLVLRIARNYLADDNKYHARLRNELIGIMRSSLAKITVDYLDPKLIIIDEFQRFRSMFDDIKPDSLQEKILDNKNVPVLLLSATPYKIYTMSEEEAHHCKEFKDTLKYLYGASGDAKVNALDGLFCEYVNRLKKFVKKDEKIIRECIDRKLIEVKNKIENELKKVMLRVERRLFFEDCNETIHAKPESAPVKGSALEEFLLLSDMLEGTPVNRHALLEYWKSDDHLLNFMDKGYELIRKPGNSKIREMFGLLRRKGLVFLKKSVKHYRNIAISNFKLSNLTAKIIPHLRKTKALWLAPTYSYYDDESVDKRKKCLPKKYLIFSNWRFVPKAISMFLSYEAERVLLGEKHKDYYDDQKRKPLLVFRSSKKKNKRLDTYSILNIFYPSMVLASKISHLMIRAKHGKPMEYAQMHAKAVAIFSEELPSLNVTILPGNKPSDKGVTIFDILLFLDYQYLKREKKASYGAILDGLKGAEKIITRTDSTESVFGEYIADIEDKLKNMPTKISVSLKDVKVLADIALSSPGVCLMRMALGLFPRSKTFKTEHIYSRIFKVSLLSARSYFNKYWVRAIIESEIKDKKEGLAYWKKILRYCANNHFQEVIDEYGYMVKMSQHAEAGGEEKELDGFIEDFGKAMGIQTGTPTYYDGRSSKSGIRCHFAMRFGDEAVEGKGGQVRGPQVREAFNSPFWPFVLATTSIGQEGLDFHRYCKDVVHWNLPSNPVDLEQREGRVNRYNSITIRQNIKDDFSLTRILNEIPHDGGNLWRFVFDYVNNNTDVENILKKGIAPNWIYTGPQKISRHLFFNDFSRDHEKYKRLKKHLTYYRLAFGQPRQDDLVDYLSAEIKNKKDVGKYLPIYMVNLAPDFSAHVRKRAMSYATIWVKEKSKSRVKKLIVEVLKKLKSAREVHPDIHEHYQHMIDFLEEWTMGENIFAIDDWEAKNIIAGLVYLLDPFDKCCDYYRQTAYKEDVKFMETIQEKIRRKNQIKINRSGLGQV